MIKNNKKKMKSSSIRVKGFTTVNTKKNHHHFNESWNNKNFPLNLPHKSLYQSNQNQRIIQKNKS